MAGDVLRTVEGRRAGNSVEDVKGIILGPPGTSVRMVFARGGKEFEVTLVRSLSDPTKYGQASRTRVAEPQSPRRHSGGFRNMMSQLAKSILRGEKEKSADGTPLEISAASQPSGWNDPEVRAST
jgi:hypothetical protein